MEEHRQEHGPMQHFPTLFTAISPYNTNFAPSEQDMMTIIDLLSSDIKFHPQSILWLLKIHAQKKYSFFSPICALVCICFVSLPPPNIHMLASNFSQFILCHMLSFLLYTFQCIYFHSVAVLYIFLFDSCTAKCREVQKLKIIFFLVLILF